MNNQSICFVAGKSGGHIVPCLTIGVQKKQLNPALKTLFFSSNTFLDKKIIEHNPIVSWHIPLPLVSIYPKNLLDIVRIPYAILYSFFVSLYYLIVHRPSEIITTGGIVALPVCYAGFLLRIPIIVYCLDAVPGKAISALRPIASSIKICFKNAQQHLPYASVTPYPVKYTDHDLDMTHNDAIKHLNLDQHKKTLVILGGSQGSLFLNELLKRWIESFEFPHTKLNIIHQTGGEQELWWHNFYANHHISTNVFSYQPNLNALYAAADLILCRSGAGTLFEVAFFNKPCITIPLKTATTTHQIDNARAISSQYPQLFEWYDQESITKNPQQFFDHIQKKLNL